MRRLVPVVCAALLGAAAPARAADAPVLTLTVPVPPPVIASEAVSDLPELDYRWTASWGSAPLTYEYRTGVRIHGGSTIAWDDPQPIAEAQVSVPVAVAPEERCFQVRATDSAGTTGPWTTPSCTYVDSTPPWIDWTGSWSPIRPALARTPVRVTYRGGDDDRVASYAVLARLAPAGRPWGAWATARSTWPAGSNVCFLVRARDRAGHLGRTDAVNDPRCTTIPYDDRGLASSGGATRARASWALGGTTTVLAGRAALTGPRTPMQSVWVSMRGHGGYCPRLWIGDRRIAQWRCHWSPIGGRPGFLYQLPRTLTGKATVRAGVHDRVRVDAVAFAR